MTNDMHHCCGAATTFVWRQMKVNPTIPPSHSLPIHPTTRSRIRTSMEGGSFEMQHLSRSSDPFFTCASVKQHTHKNENEMHPIEYLTIEKRNPNLRTQTPTVETKRRGCYPHERAREYIDPSIDRSIDRFFQPTSIGNFPRFWERRRPAAPSRSFLEDCHRWKCRRTQRGWVRSSLSFRLLVLSLDFRKCEIRNPRHGRKNRRTSSKP